MLESHTWDEKLDLGHEAMDHDHHTQIALVSAFAEALEQGRPAMATRLANQLSQYSRVHFGSEELLMEAAGYADAKPHGGEHATLLEQIDAMKSAHESGEATLALSLAIEFRTALAGHMAGADRKLAEHVRSRRDR